MERKDISSWLSGPRAALAEQGLDLGYPGQRLYLPAQGQGSVASMGRRMAALFVDWFACMAISALINPSVAFRTKPLLTLVIFVIEVVILSTLTGSSFGQRIMGIGLIGLDGNRVGVGRIAVRTWLLSWVIPAIVYDRDGRGLHDKVANCVVVRLR